VSIFISPNMPLDENGDLVDQTAEMNVLEEAIDSAAPPVYGEHMLDQLCEDSDGAGNQTPGLLSGASSPYSEQSRTASAEDLGQEEPPSPDDRISPAALTLRLQAAPTSRRRRNISVSSVGTSVGSSLLTRMARDQEPASGRSSPEHIDYAEFSSLNQVPSYETAVRTPARSRALSGGVMLPDYRQSVLLSSGGDAERLFTIPEITVRPSSMVLSQPRTSRARPLSMSAMFLQRLSLSDNEERSRLSFLQPRERVSCH
jgi:hypothetical protein